MLNQILNDDERLARDSYYAYGGVTDFKNFQGNPMPEWGELPEKIQQAWIAASQHAVHARFVTLDDRERVQIEHALKYTDEYSSAGAPGHGQFLLIAKLARALGIG